VSDSATPSSSPLPPAGWYPDPVNGARIRYWDGSQWAAAAQGSQPEAIAPQTVGAGATASPTAAATSPSPAGATQPAPYPAAPSAPRSYEPAPKTESFAVAALVLGLLGFVTTFLTAIPAIIFGFLARGRIKRTGNSGGGMALAGIILGFVEVGIAILGIVIAVALIVTGSAVVSSVGGINGAAARATAIAIGADVSSCQSRTGSYPSDQSTFDSCTANTIGTASGSSNLLPSGATARYWLRADGKSFCVEVDRTISGTEYTGAWDTAVTVPTQGTCPESAGGATPTATVSH